MTYDDPLDKLPPLTRLIYKRMRWERDMDIAGNPHAPRTKREEAIDRLIERGELPVGNLDYKPGENWMDDLEEAFRD
jgi:hypothetical protein